VLPVEEAALRQAPGPFWRKVRRAGRCTVQCQSGAALCRQIQQTADQRCRNNDALMQQNYQASRDSGSERCIMTMLLDWFGEILSPGHERKDRVTH